MQTDNFIKCANNKTSIDELPELAKTIEHCGAFHMTTGNVIVQFDCICKSVVSDTYYLQWGRTTTGIIRNIQQDELVELARQQGARIIKEGCNE